MVLDMTEINLIYVALFIGVVIRFFLAYLYKIYSGQIVLFGWEDFFKRMRPRYIYSSAITFVSALPVDAVLDFTKFPDPHGYVFALLYGIGGLTLMNLALKFQEKYNK